MATLNEIIQTCIARLSMVSGTAVQTYAEDKIKYMIIEKFELLFEEQFWNRHCANWQTFTLDGASGTLIENVSDYFDRLEDIRIISVGNNTQPLKLLQPSINPSLIKGGVPRFYMQHPTASKVVRICPFTSSGTVSINYRKRNIPVDPNDEVEFDKNCIVFAVCADYLLDDGDSLNSQKFNEMFHQRLNKLKANENTGITSFDGRINSSFMTEWS